MAMVITTAKVTGSWKTRKSPPSPTPPNGEGPPKSASPPFSSEPAGRCGAIQTTPGPDLVVRRKGIEYAVEVKAAPEGRSDRLVPLFAQAVLQAAHAATQKAAPLAVVAAPRISRRAAEQVMAFAQRYAPDAAAGVIDFEGFAMFRGPHLEELNAEGKELPVSVRQSVRDSGRSSPISTNGC